MKKIIAVLCCLIVFIGFSFAQFTHADTLRGSNGEGRNWWDATKYNLHVKFNLEDSSISGYNVISIKNLSKDPPPFLQIDLQEPMIMDSVIVSYQSVKKGKVEPNLFKGKLSFTAMNCGNLNEKKSE